MTFIVMLLCNHLFALASAGSYLLSFVFGLGFSGCGLATTIARGVMLLAIVSHICKTEDIRR